MNRNSLKNIIIIVCAFILVLILCLFVSKRPIFDIATPYNAFESANWLMKSVAGLRRNNPAGVEAIPSSYMLNENITPEYKLTFVGDIMPEGNSEVVFSDEIKNFVAGSDYLIGNFEGTITAEKKVLPFIVSDLHHTKKVVETLSGLFPPEKTYLSVSNNHAGDLGKEEFFESIEILEKRGFNMFGWNERPFFDINDDIRIVAGTMWSNRKRDYVFMLENAESKIKPGVFNFLYPHFGYELELYPRQEIFELGRILIKAFDAVIGHHTHCPQPIIAESVNGTNKLLAYSLGDFLGELTTKKYQYGIIVKVVLGKNTEGKWFLGKVEWRQTRCSFLSDGVYMVNVSDDGI